LKDYYYYYHELELLVPERGYHYKDKNGKDMVEIHVDDIPESSLLTEINNTLKFGGKCSEAR
jgi:hypothetical protein